MESGRARLQEMQQEVAEEEVEIEESGSEQGLSADENAALHGLRSSRRTMRKNYAKTNR